MLHDTERKARRKGYQRQRLLEVTLEEASEANHILAFSVNVCVTSLLELRVSVAAKGEQRRVQTLYEEEKGETQVRDGLLIHRRRNLFPF